MAFYYLSSEEIRELVRAGEDSMLIFKPRQLLFQFITPRFWGTLNQDPAPLEQFRADLGNLNRVERLEDNTVPLAIYLDNAADLIDQLPQAKIFRKYQNKVQNRATGTTSVATLASLPATVITKQAIIHQDDTVTRAYLELCLKTARSVAKLVTPRFDADRQHFVNGRPWLFNGTGWLIAPNLIITNHHVVNSRSGDDIAAPGDFNRQAREMLVHFDFDSDGATLDTQTVAVVEAADRDLDYCILRLAQDSGREALPLTRTPTQITAASYLPLNIIQHPQGNAKRFAVRNNLAVEADDTLLKYYTDTDYGSSGSPVLDDEWKVRALHRGAVYQEAKFQGRDTAYVNVGSQISSILEHLKAANPAVYARI
jgi:hypothetical protein